MDKIKTRYTRRELELERKALKRRLVKINALIDAYDDGRATHVETYQAHEKRAKTAEEIAEHTGADPEKIRDGLDAVRLPDNLGEE
jgi:hypothetical protein